MLRKLSLPFWLLLLLFLLLSLAGAVWYFGFRPMVSIKQQPADAGAILPTDLPADLPTATPEIIEPIVITFLGDMMFDRNIRTKAEASGYEFILAEVEQLWQDSDLVVGNLEAPITDADSVSQGSVVGSTNNFIFTTDPAIIAVLKQYPFVAVLGNNHIGNFGINGIIETETNLETAGIPFFGQTGYANSPTATVIEVKGLKIALINYNQFVTGGEAQVFEDLAELSQTTDLQIIYTHWGNEYEPEARPVIVELARRLVDAGADQIIGSHPHVIQNHESYRGAPIFYSLGNFVFDQYFSEAVRTGLVVTTVIDPQTLEITTQQSLVRMETSGQTVPLARL